MKKKSFPCHKRKRFFFFKSNFESKNLFKPNMSLEILIMNLICPNFHDFQWYKDIFLTKVMVRDNCFQTFWKERFIFELPKFFAERVRNSIKNNNNDTISYATLTYGEIVNYINKVGIALCSYMILKSKHDKIDCHLAKICFRTIFFTSFCSTFFEPLQFYRFL